MRSLKNLATLFLLLSSGILLLISRAYLADAQICPSIEGDLYLPEPTYLRFISLGHDGLVSDLVLAKALTYYGSHYQERQTFGYKHLEKLFITAIEMDPRNREAILMAANIISNTNIRSAIEILKRGMLYHPEDWKFPEMIGYFYFFQLNDPHTAARYYEMASRLPGHPPYIPSLSGKFYQESGRYEEAIRVLYNFYTQTQDPRLKVIFKDTIQGLMEKMKAGDFLLRAEISRVMDIGSVEFRPDRHNPQFQFMAPVETLKIEGIEPLRPGPGHSPDDLPVLFARFQQDFAYFVLSGQMVRIRFVRDKNGRLQQDSFRRYLGSLTLKNNTHFLEAAHYSGVLDGSMAGFPPPVIDLELQEIQQQVGRIVSVRFRVQRVTHDSGFIYLDAASSYRNTFRVVIPMADVPVVSGKKELQESLEYFLGFEGKKIIVSGLALVSGGVIQIKVYSAKQVNGR